MTEAKIGAKLPKTLAANGLHSIAPDLLSEPHQIRYAVIAIDCGAVTTEYKWDDFGDRITETVPSARIRAIEPLAGDAAMTALHLMDQARAHRSGRPMLPLDFSGADPQ